MVFELIVGLVKIYPMEKSGNTVQKHWWEFEIKMLQRTGEWRV